MQSSERVEIRFELNELKEFPFHGLFLEDAAVFGSYRTRINVSYAPRIHAEVFGIDHAGHILGTQRLLHGLHDLTGHPLLNLRPLGEVIHKAIHLAQPNDLALAYVGQMCPTHNGQKVVLTGRVDHNVLFHQHLAVAVLVFESGHFGHLVCLQSGKEFIDHHLCNPLWCALKAVVRQVQAQCIHDACKVLPDPLLFFLVAECKGICAQGRVRRGRVMIAVVERIFPLIG